MRKKSIKPANTASVTPRGLRRQPMLPLKRPRHEAFAQAFSKEFDGVAAARAAGYGQGARRAWSRLLKCRAMQARIMALASGLAVPGADTASILKEFTAECFVDISTILRRDARSGAEIYDLDKATPRQLRALDIRQEVINRGGRKTVRTSIRPRNLPPFWRLIAAEFGIGTKEAVVPPPTDLAMAFAELQARGSKATLRRD